MNKTLAGPLLLWVAGGTRFLAAHGGLSLRHAALESTFADAPIQLDANSLALALCIVLRCRLMHRSRRSTFVLADQDIAPLVRIVPRVIFAGALRAVGGVVLSGNRSVGGPLTWPTGN